MLTSEPKLFYNCDNCDQLRYDQNISPGGSKIEPNSESHLLSNINSWIKRI